MGANLTQEGCPIRGQIYTCVVLYCIYITILYKSITIKNEAKQ